jgi:hypothetical protein
VRSDPLTPPDATHAFSPGGLNVDRTHGETKLFGKAMPYQFEVGYQPRLLSQDRRINVARLVTRNGEIINNNFQ